MDGKTIPHKWEVKFRISPSLKKSETIEDYRFDVRGQETFVEVNYTTFAFNEKPPGSEGDYDYADQIEARRTASKIRDLMVERMVYQRAFQPIKVDIAAGPTLVNKNEFSKESRPVGRSLSIKYRVLDVNDSIEESHNFWKSGFKNKTKGREGDFLRIAGWLQRSQEESDEINSFITAWIGFNDLYGLFDKISRKNANGEAAKINNAINELVKDEASQIVNDYSSALDKLQSYGIKSYYGINWSEELKKERQNPNRPDVEIIRKAMICVYGVRNQVFHEAGQQKNLANMTMSSKDLLILVATTCLKNFINC